MCLGGGPEGEAVGSGGVTAADCGLRHSSNPDNNYSMATGTQKKKKKKKKFVPDPPSCVQNALKCVRKLQTPYPFVVKEPVVWKHGNTATQE